jgi:hypothetical protein
MSSNYFYKSISVSQICSNNGNATVSGYTGMPGTSYTSYSGLRPLTFGYKSGTQAVDLCNQYTAPNTGAITTSQTINIRSYAKACRVISVGGAGGGGGHGGKAYSVAYDGDDAEGWGGSGGAGGYGSYTYNNYISLSGYNTISVTVGDGGLGGAAGEDKAVESTYNLGNFNYTNVKANGTPGESGKAGGDSYIILNGTTDWLSVATGGNGGGGGKGGEANATGSSANANNGAGGLAGNSTSSTSNDGNYPVLSNYGIPSGTISVDGARIGGGYPGTHGAVQIIWLYD